MSDWYDKKKYPTKVSVNQIFDYNHKRNATKKFPKKTRLQRLFPWFFDKYKYSLKELVCNWSIVILLVVIILLIIILVPIQITQLNNTSQSYRDEMVLAINNDIAKLGYNASDQTSSLLNFAKVFLGSNYFNETWFNENKSAIEQYLQSQNIDTTNLTYQTFLTIKDVYYVDWNNYITNDNNHRGLYFYFNDSKNGFFFNLSSDNNFWTDDTLFALQKAIYNFLASALIEVNKDTSSFFTSYGRDFLSDTNLTGSLYPVLTDTGSAMTNLNSFFTNVLSVQTSSNNIVTADFNYNDAYTDGSSYFLKRNFSISFFDFDDALSILTTIYPYYFTIAIFAMIFFIFLSMKQSCRRTRIKRPEKYKVWYEDDMNFMQRKKNKNNKKSHFV